MPQNKFALARYRLIDELLRQQTFIKTNFVVNMCMERLGFNVTQRTIQMDIEALKNDPFLGCFYPISYCKRRKAYYFYDEPITSFSTLCISRNEILLLRELKNILSDKLVPEDYETFSSFLTKLENSISEI